MIQLKPAVNSNDHILGNNLSAIELVEYGDYQCPHCGQAHPIIKNILRNFGPGLKFVFRNFPLSEIHPNAFAAAVATEAARLQGKFWEMHDMIFENQEALEAENLLFYAGTLGLDTRQFEIDIQKKELAARVVQDFESGISSGVNGTPSFFINGRKFNGNWREQGLYQYLESLVTNTATLW